MNKLKSLVAVFALAFAVSNVGCVVQGQDAEAPAENLATQIQAIEFGDVMAGVDGAVKLGTMLSDLSEFGTPVTEGMVYGELLKTQKEIAALRSAVDNIQQELGQQDQQMLALAALGSVSNTTGVFDGYWMLKDTPAEQQRLLSSIRNTGESGFGSISWTTLDQLDALVVGNGEVQSALQILSDHTTRSFDTMKQDRIGRFMADRRLIQEKAFFVMSRAYADMPAVVRAQRAKLDDRLAKQDAAFIAATRAYNQATYDQETQNTNLKLRDAMVGKAPGTYDPKAMIEAAIRDQDARYDEARGAEILYNQMNLAGSYRGPDGNVIEAKLSNEIVLSWVGTEQLVIQRTSATRLLWNGADGLQKNFTVTYDKPGNVLRFTSPTGEVFTRE